MLPALGVGDVGGPARQPVLEARILEGVRGAERRLRMTTQGTHEQDPHGGQKDAGRPSTNLMCLHHGREAVSWGSSEARYRRSTWTSHLSPEDLNADSLCLRFWVVS